MYLDLDNIEKEINTDIDTSAIKDNNINIVKLILSKMKIKKEKNIFLFIFI